MPRVRKPAPSEKLEVFECAWIAGIVEGEGSIAIQPRSERSLDVTLKVAMTDKDVIERLQEWSGVGSVYGPIDKGDGRKDQWAWQVSSHEEFAWVVKQIEPYLLERRSARANEALVALSEHRENVRKFCPSGHNKDEVGVNYAGVCSKCRSESERRRNAKRSAERVN